MQDEKKKKTTRKKRSQVKNAALKKQYNSKIRQEYLDYDYLDKLNEEEMAWLNNFTEEHLNANFAHNGEKLIEDPEYKKKIYNENNARNRCVYSTQRAQGRLHGIEETFATETKDTVVSNNELEDALIDYIDNKEED